MATPEFPKISLWELLFTNKQRDFFKQLGKLARTAVEHTRPLPEKGYRGNHTFHNNHLPVGDSEAYEPMVGYPDEEVETYEGQLFVGDTIASPDQYRHPFDSLETRDVRDL